MLIIEKLVNVLTGEETIIEREQTDQERVELEAEKLREAKFADKQAQKAQKRAPILERLGITEEEAKLLLG